MSIFSGIMSSVAGKILGKGLSAAFGEDASQIQQPQRIPINFAEARTYASSASGKADTEFKLSLKHLLDKHVSKGGEEKDD